MDWDEGLKVIMGGAKGFHGRFKKMYGQLAIRLDDFTYLTTGGNKLLAGITEDNIERCDISTGDLGEIFRKRPDINAFIFGCTPDLVEVSNNCDYVPAAIDDLAMIAGQGVKVIPDAAPSTILAELGSTGAAIVRGTGVISMASNIKKAVAACQIVQKSCEAVIHGKLIGGIKPFAPETANAIRENFIRHYVEANQEASVPYIGHDEETFVSRTKIIECGKDLVRSDLVYGSWGNISVRLDRDSMLITPSSMDYFEIRVEDIVKMNLDSLEYSNQRMPSTEALLHERMYKELPDCSAIIHTHSNAMGVFAACGAGFAITDPVMRQLIGDIKIVPYAPTGSAELADNVVTSMRDTHAAILANHGAIFYGPNLDVVFEIAKAVELMARNLLQYDKKLDINGKEASDEAQQ